MVKNLKVRNKIASEIDKREINQVAPELVTRDPALEPLAHQL